MGACATAATGAGGGAGSGAEATLEAVGGGATQTPASHTRSPLQSVSLAHWACESPLLNKIQAPPKPAKTL